MSLNNSNKIETNKYELEISVGKDKFQEAVTQAFKKNAKKITVPGFRKGKAPRHIIEQYYGEGVFYEDAVNALYPSEYDAAVKEAGITPVDQAKIEIKSLDKDGFTFKATVTVKPEVEVGEYKGLKVTKKIYTASDEEVDEELKRIQRRNARIKTVDDRPVQKDDTVVIDFEGFVDGVAFEGGKAEKQELTIGSNTFIPGFEDQIIGHKTGEEFDINVTFPEKYQVEKLAGKPAVFKIKLHEIKMNELPELDDEFAKDVSEFDTLDEYKKDIKKHIQESKDNKSNNDVDDALIDQIIGGMKAEIPEVMFEHAIDNMVNDFDYRLQMQGLNVQSYLQYTGMEMDSFRKTFREQAERQVKIRLALEKIADIEKFEISDDEVEEEYKKYADRYNVDVEKVKVAIAKDTIVNDLQVGKAVDFIRDNAIIKEEKAEDKPKQYDKAEKAADAEPAEEKPAKKTRSRTTKAAKDEKSDK
jgi:trigger factor